MLQSVGLQKVRHDLAPEQQQYIYIYIYTHIYREISFEELVACILLGVGKSKIYRTGWQTGDPGSVDVAGQV